MRIIRVIAPVMLAGAFLTATAAPKKDKKLKEDTKTAVVLSSYSDTLSYVAGVMVTEGLLPYILKAGVDTTYMKDFIQGYLEYAYKSEDPRVVATLVGMEVARTTQQRMIPGWKKDLKGATDSIENSLVHRGLIDAITNDTTLFTLVEATKEFKSRFEATKRNRDEKLYGENRRAGNDFLMENRNKEGVVCLPSGLQYKVLVEGDGPTPKRTDKVLVNYEGRLIDGTVFDSSSKNGDQPATFKANQVIKGWTEALCLMPLGSKWELYIPYTLAYGEKESGQILPYSALIFEVELVGIEESKKTASNKN